MPVKSLYLFILFLLPLNSSQAAIVPDLYDFEVEVADQSEKNRRQAISEAMRGVLVKLTGERAIISRPDVIGIVQEAERFIQQYEYRQKIIEDPENPDNTQRQLRLWARFNKSALQNKLRENGIPQWGHERPTTLVWLVIQDEKGRNYVSQDLYPEIIEQLNFQASQRGIQLIYPLFDLEDTMQVKTSDIWVGFNDIVILASERYQPDAIIIGTMEKKGEEQWSTRWTTRIKQQATNWDFTAPDMEIALNDGVDGLADRLAQNYTQPVFQGNASSFDIIVGDIGSYERYVRVMEYLSGINSVSEVLLKSANTEQMTFTIISHGGGELALAQAIELGRVMESSGTENTYRLLP